MANCWKEKAVLLREKAGLNVSVRSQEVMEAKKDKPFQASQRCLEEGTKTLKDFWGFVLTSFARLHWFCFIRGTMCCGDYLGLARSLKKTQVSSDNDIHSIAI